jgi:hypothetical protein
VTQYAIQATDKDIEESNDHPTVCSFFFSSSAAHGHMSERMRQSAKVIMVHVLMKNELKKKETGPCEVVMCGQHEQIEKQHTECNGMQHLVWHMVKKKNGCNSISHWDAGDERKTRRNAATDRSGPCEVSEGKWE